MDSNWHPILSAKEYEPARWVMFDAYEKPYALIDLVKRGEEIGYRATTWNAEKTEGVVIGYYRSLAGACSSVHGLWIGRGVPSGAPSADWADRWPKKVDPWGEREKRPAHQR